MLNDAEDKIIDEITKQMGLTEDNCLDGLSEQQRKLWVHSALLGKTEKQLLNEFMGGRKNVSESTVRYVLEDARLRIVANILKDADILLEAQHKPTLRTNVQALIWRVEESKKKKGAKSPCRRGSAKIN